jgi:16S rRNA (cytidine1402-2'-O)-methyltransferase
VTGATGAGAARDGGGALVLVGTPIGNLGDLTPRAVEALRRADVVACEDTRRTGRLLQHAGIEAGGRLRAVHAHNEAVEAARIVDDVAAGRRVAYVSDAGMPGVSDPGQRIAAACIARGQVVDVVPGPDAVVTALVLSGLATDRFVFEGFLPRKGRERRARLADLGDEARTVVLYESPHRIAATLADLRAACGRERPVAVLRELTKLHQDAFRGSLDAAAGLAAAFPARGEHVIVLAGAPASSAPVGDDTVRAALREALDRGASVRDASAEVAATLHLPRRRVYALAVEI